MPIDIGTGNLLASFFDPKPITFSYRWSHAFRVIMLSALLLYLAPLVYCWLTQPSVFRQVPGLTMPFLLDFGAFTMQIILVPLLIMNFRSERRLLAKTYMRLFAGPLHDIVPQNEIEALPRYYRKWNRWSLLVCVAFSIFISWTWLESFQMDGKISWHTYGSLAGAEFLNPGGWYSLVAMVGFFWLLLSSTVLRFFIHFIKFSKLTRHRRVQVNPLHPDKCGGLSMISDLVKSNRTIVLSIGLIIASLFVTDIIVLDRPILSLTNVSMLFGFVVLCVLAFILPLLPYKASMRETKYETLEKISLAFQKNWSKEFEKLDQDRTDLMDAKNLRELKSVYDFAKQMPVWPFNIETLRSFIKFAIIPFLAMFLSTVYQKLIQQIIR